MIRMSHYVYNKHNTPCKVLCTIFTHSFLYQKSNEWDFWYVNNYEVFIERFYSSGQLYKFIGTKGSVYIRKEFNSHRICLELQHGRHFIILEHQNERRDVMWKRSISMAGILTRSFTCTETMKILP